MSKLHFTSDDNKGINPKNFVDQVVLITSISPSKRLSALRYACDQLNAPKADIDAFYADCSTHITI